ncbi:MAG: GNAT family N-acetyltransferase [Candidatus Sumerlaeia bacterium]|nr:GNAT family N-acetyltransferase [Candidatus Sumerlaeia bacterium]
MAETDITLDIHPIEPDETDAAVELITKCVGEYDAYDCDMGQQDLQPERMEDLYEEPKGKLWVAKVGDQIVGTIGLRRVDDRTCRISRLSVHPDYRKHDVVQQLEKTFEDYARSQGYRRATAELAVRQKPAAVFLESVGFEEFKRTLRNKMVVVTFEKTL